MELYMKQKFFSFGDKFSIFDENGNEKYYIEGEVFSVGTKLHVYDSAKNELLFIRQKVFSLLPRYYIMNGDKQVAEVVKEFTLFKQEYTVCAEGATWQVHGDFFDHEYEISDGGRCIAIVSKEWFSFGDAYKISILPGVDERLALAVVLIVDACIEADRDN